uniref:Sodium-coupled monocarboxylate transporter 1 n=1 Tax=Dicentrarchus labrax TaxID=13489 RepID=A0A8C4I6D1_DICLA
MLGTRADYVVFALMLVVSAAVGFYYAWVSRSQESSTDFLIAGRRLTALPVSLSLTASFMSSITVLSNPAEVYCYGAIFVYFGLAYILAMVVISEVFLPVFYRLALISTYEYLELRFNRATRLLGTVLFIVQTILYTGIVIYGPALALSQVTDLDLWSGIISTGIVCTLYCTLRGLVSFKHCNSILSNRCYSGQARKLFSDHKKQDYNIYIYIFTELETMFLLCFTSFDINPQRRHTFWTTVIGGTFGYITVYGTNQSQVQRYVSCKSITHARVALYINLLGLFSFLLGSVFAGMCLYSVYKNCDPWTAGLVSAPDQLMPYMVIDMLTDYPGLPGLFFASVYSGSLSTVSSSINALAAVTLEDFIKPYTNMSEKHLFWMSKGLSFFYGVLCITMGRLASVMGGMMQAGVIVSGVIGGPLLGLFTLGILCPLANSKGALSGLVSGLAASLCVSLEALMYPSPPTMTRPLSLTTEGCNFTTTHSLNWTTTALPTESSSITTAPLQNSDNKYVYNFL